MLREARRPFLRVGLAMVWVAAALAPSSCAKIWGIDDGIPFPDASTTDVTAGQDVTTQDAFVEAASEAATDAGAEAADASDAADASEAGEPGDAADAGTEACSPILSWCIDHCGTGPNNCGQNTICGNICGTGDGIFCDASTNQCDCTTDPTWCSGRCGTTTDNCGRSDNCGTCGADACVPMGNPCTGLSCGTSHDTCGNVVNCGAGGTIQCDAGGICDAGSCCQPNPNACSGFCNSAPNGCGGTTGCSSTCPIAGETCVGNQCVCPTPACDQACNTTVSNGCNSIFCGPCTGGQECAPNNQCCTPTGCGAVNCQDTCGVTQSACCQDSGPSCAGPGGTCNTSVPCCTSGGFTCVSGICQLQVVDSGGPPVDAGGPPPVDAGGGLGDP